MNYLCSTRLLPMNFIRTKEGFPPIPVPRHKGDIPIGTAKKILKAAGLEDNR